MYCMLSSTLQSDCDKWNIRSEAAGNCNGVAKNLLQGRKPIHLLHAGFPLCWFSILKMEMTRSCETSVHLWTTRRYIPEDGNIQNKSKSSLENFTLTMWHSLSAEVGTNFADKRRSLGRYRSFADSGHGVLQFLVNKNTSSSGLGPRWRILHKRCWLFAS
jgi:hypothetical protein